MRKKLIFLLIFFSVPTLTLNETSCFCFNKRKEDNSLIDISNEKFDNFKLEKVLTGDLLYAEVRTQIGGWINPSLSATEIKEDKSLSLRILDLDNNIINDSTDIEVKSYTAKIAVGNGDIYFHTQRETNYSINVVTSRNKINISTKLFNDVSLSSLTTGDSLYSEVRTQMAGWAEPEISENIIEQDQYTTIKIEDSGGIVINDDNTYTIIEDIYKVIIKVDSNDQYFQTQSETNYSIDVSSERTKVDISDKEFNNWDANNNNNADLLYTALYTQVGNWAEPVITGNVVKSDENIEISIFDSDGYLIHDSSSETFETGIHNIHIIVYENDKYFNEQLSQRYTITIT